MIELECRPKITITSHSDCNATSEYGGRGRRECNKLTIEEISIAAHIEPVELHCLFHDVDCSMQEEQSVSIVRSV